MQANYRSASVLTTDTGGAVDHLEEFFLDIPVSTFGGTGENEYTITTCGNHIHFKIWIFVNLDMLLNIVEKWRIINFYLFELMSKPYF